MWSCSPWRVTHAPALVTSTVRHASLVPFHALAGATQPVAVPPTRYSTRTPALVNHTHPLRGSVGRESHCCRLPGPSRHTGSLSSGLQLPL